LLVGTEDYLITYFCYEIKILTTTLTPSFYSDFQMQLSDLILKYHNLNLTFKQIAERLNKKGLKTPRGKIIKANHCFSIMKKRLKRDERINEEPINILEESQPTSILYSHRDCQFFPA
jgi:hypothetical protein